MYFCLSNINKKLVSSCSVGINGFGAESHRQRMMGFVDQKNVKHHQTNPVIDSQSQKVPQTPLVPGRVVHSGRFSRKAAFSLIDPAQAARFPKSDGLSFSRAVTALSPLPKADTGDGAATVEAVETEVGAEVVDLGWLEG